LKIGLIDVDGHNYPNLPLMKTSAWHKEKGDLVQWYEPLDGLVEEYDIVYMSKVFSFTPDYMLPIYSKKITKGGSGYCIKLVNGKEKYMKKRDVELPNEIEHIYPDYSLYPKMTKDTAYGFLTRGCPVGCEFCHVACKEGKKSYKVADLSEFWKDQKNIVICDPNTLAYLGHLELLQQLVDSKAKVNFNQGLDIRRINDKNLELIKQIRLDGIHFAYDRYENKNIIEQNLKSFKESTGYDKNKGRVTVYILTNFNTTIEQDIERIQFCRSLKFSPYPMIYNKGEFVDQNGRLKPYQELLQRFTTEQIKHFIKTQKLQRWCNNFIFWNTPTFEEYVG